MEKPKIRCIGRVVPRRHALLRGLMEAFDTVFISSKYRVTGVSPPDPAFSLILQSNSNPTEEEKFGWMNI